MTSPEAMIVETQVTKHQPQEESRVSVLLELANW